MRSGASLLMLSVLLVSVAGSAGTHDPQALVDPVLRAATADSVPDVAILVIEPERADLVYARLAASGLQHVTWPYLSQAAVVVLPGHLDRIAAWPGVVTVWRNEVMHAYLDRAAPYVGADVMWRTYGYTGQGVAIMVVDTGVDGSHPDVRYGENLVENVVPSGITGEFLGGSLEGVAVSDVDGHGTHVAGIVGGTGLAGGSGHPDHEKYRGIAPRASLIGYQAGVEGPDGEVRFESVTVLEAFNYALATKAVHNLRIVTNSWGTGGKWEPHNPINQATLNLYRAGMVVTFAAGNDGAQGEGTINKYCVAPWVLCVAAGDYTNRRASFSSMGTEAAVSGLPYDHPDIMAPGAGVRAARATSDPTSTEGVLPLPPVLPTGTAAYYVSKSGTSMATPAVAGAAALLLEQNPEFSPDNVYDILVASSTPLAEPLWVAGAGYLNLLEAHRLAQRVDGDLASFLDGNVKYAGRLSGDPAFANDPTSVGLGIGPTGRLRSADVAPGQLVNELVTTPLGLAFLIGTVMLGIIAFAPGKARRV